MSKTNRNRNISLERGTYWYARTINGKRHHYDLQTSDVREARRERDIFEEKAGIPSRRVRTPRGYTFADFATKFMQQEAPNRLAPTTLRDFECYLKSDGVILSHLGDLHVSAITFAELRAWWQHEIDGQRHVRTGRNYLGAIAAVVAFAHDELVDTQHEFEPQIVRFREWLGRKSKGKRARAASDHQKHIRPIEDVDKLDRFVAAAQEEGAETAAAILVLLDAGIRLGELQGLSWGAVTWGKSQLDRRELLIEHNRPRGMAELQPPKSGRIRSVELSWRARCALHDLYEERFRPSTSELIFRDLDQSNFRTRAFRRCAEAADLSRIRPKDLRDSFASHLLSQGIQVGYIARQLGHSTTQITESSYARWMPKSDGRYTPPTPLLPGEVPADLLSRLNESNDAGITLDRLRGLG